MHKADRRMFHTFLDGLEGMVGRLQECSEAMKQRELAQEVRHVGEDLSFAIADFRDTLERIE